MSVVKFVSYLLFVNKTPEVIRNKCDYTRVKRWKNKASFLYFLFTAIAIVLALVILSNLSDLSQHIDLPAPLAYVAIPFVAVFFAWGLATMLLNLKLLIKSMWGATVEGYQIGEQIQTTNVYVTHEYNDRYKVTTDTENQGCVIAMIYWFINLFVWSVLCVYVCPFLAFGKIKKTKANLRRYKLAQE